MSNQVVTLKYLRSFVNGIMNVNISGNEDYCPTYSELTSGKYVQYASINDSKPSQSTCGIFIPQCTVDVGYADNQNVIQADLTLKWVTFDACSIDGTSSIDVCGGSAVVNYHPKFKIHTKTEDNTSESELIEDTSISPTWGGVNTSTGCSATITVGENEVSGYGTTSPSSVGSRDFTASCSFDFKPTNVIPTGTCRDTYTVTQGANTVSAPIYEKDTDVEVTLSGCGLIPYEGGSVTVNGTYSYVAHYYYTDSCGHEVGRYTVNMTGSAGSDTVSAGEKECETPQTIAGTASVSYTSPKGVSASNNCTIYQAANTDSCETECVPNWVHSSYDWGYDCNCHDNQIDGCGNTRDGGTVDNSLCNAATKPAKCTGDTGCSITWTSITATDYAFTSCQGGTLNKGNITVTPYGKDCNNNDVTGETLSVSEYTLSQTSFSRNTGTSNSTSNVTVTWTAYPSLTYTITITVPSGSECQSSSDPCSETSISTQYEIVSVNASMDACDTEPTVIVKGRYRGVTAYTSSSCNKDTDYGDWSSEEDVAFNMTSTLTSKNESSANTRSGSVTITATTSGYNGLTGSTTFTQGKMSTATTTVFDALCVSDYIASDCGSLLIGNPMFTVYACGPVYNACGTMLYYSSQVTKLDPNQYDIYGLSNFTLPANDTGSDKTTPISIQGLGEYANLTGVGNVIQPKCDVKKVTVNVSASFQSVATVDSEKQWTFYLSLTDVATVSECAGSCNQAPYLSLNHTYNVPVGSVITVSASYNGASSDSYSESYTVTSDDVQNVNFDLAVEYTRNDDLSYIFNYGI